MSVFPAQPAHISPSGLTALFWFPRTAESKNCFKYITALKADHKWLNRAEAVASSEIPKADPFRFHITLPKKKKSENSSFFLLLAYAGHKSQVK